MKAIKVPIIAFIFAFLMANTGVAVFAANGDGDFRVYENRQGQAEGAHPPGAQPGVADLRVHAVHAAEAEPDQAYSHANETQPGAGDSHAAADLHALQTQPQALQTQPPNEEKRVIIEYRAGHDRNRGANRRGRARRAYRNIPAESLTASPEEINEMKNDPDIAAIEEDARISALAQVMNWGAERVQAPRSWNSGFTGKGVNIAVVDTGISPHEDLRIAGGVSFDPDNASFYDDNGHGTGVAGIIAALDNNIGTVGVAPESNIYAVKVLDRNGEGYLSELLAGIDWCIDNGIDIINMSLGSDQRSRILEDMVNKAYSQGVSLASAAGNSGDAAGVSDTVNYPAKYNVVIGVAATDVNNGRAVFSSTGAGIDVSAPGVNIYTTAMGNGYASGSGTSMATPYVSGNLALLKQAHPNADNNLLREMLYNEVIPLGNPLWYGRGLIQVPALELTYEEPGPSAPGPGPEDLEPAQGPEPAAPDSEGVIKIPEEPAAQGPADQSPPQGGGYSPPPQGGGGGGGSSPSQGGGGGTGMVPSQGGGAAGAPPSKGAANPPSEKTVSPPYPEEPKYRALTQEPINHTPAEEAVFPRQVEPGVISVLVNGKYIDFSKYNNITPIVTEGRALLPVRAIAESLGLTVDWHSDSKTVIINTQEPWQYIQYGKPGIINVLANGQFIDFGKYDNVTPIIIKGRTLLPIRAVSESLGLKIDWDDQNKTIVIS